MNNLTPTIQSAGGFENLTNRIAMMLYMDVPPDFIMKKLVKEGFTTIDVRLAYAGAILLNEDRRP